MPPGMATAGAAGLHTLWHLPLTATLAGTCLQPSLPPPAAQRRARLPLSALLAGRARPLSLPCRLTAAAAACCLTALLGWTPCILVRQPGHCRPLLPSHCLPSACLPYYPKHAGAYMPRPHATHSAFACRLPSRTATQRLACTDPHPSQSASYTAITGTSFQPGTVYTPPYYSSLK